MWPALVATAVLLPLFWAAHRELDLVSVDDDTPLVVGVRLELLRLGVLVGAALLASTAVSAVCVVGFVGLVAPNAARALVTGRHLYVVPVAVLLGAILLSLADTLGRTARPRSPPDWSWRSSERRTSCTCSTARAADSDRQARAAGTTWRLSSIPTAVRQRPVAQSTARTSSRPTTLPIPTPSTSRTRIDTVRRRTT